MKRYKIALAGHPNSGKTTIFNQLAGAWEKVGNWSGTTVERKEGMLNHRGNTLAVIDLPGTCTLSAYSIDERIARDFLIHEKPDMVVVTVDSTHLEQNLYLTLQLLEMGQKVVLVLNMMDRARMSATEIKKEQLSKILGIPVVLTAALRGEGIALLKDTIVDNLETPALAPLHIDYAELEESIRAFEGFLTQHHIDTGLPQRTTAIKILENDPDILKVAQADGRHSEVSRIAHDAERRCAADTESFIMERRYAYLKGLATECVRRHLTIHQRFTISDKIDKVVTNRFIGIPIFLGFMYGLFSLVFVVGEPMVNAIDRSFEFLAGRAAELIATAGLPAWCMSLVSDGIIAGVGSVLVFLPYILLLFLGITFLEHSGYLARAAFIMDRVMHALNLHGKSFIPMLLGFGCNIPAILATRTLESEKDRIITVLIVPLMSCSARLPVYTLFAAALFPRHRGLVVFSLYLLGVVLAVIMARIFKKVLFKGESSALVMELPPYRLPNIKHLAVHMWLMAWLFIKKAGTVIFAAVIVLWILASLPAGVEYGSPESIIGGIGRHLAPLFKPAGFGFWQAGVALVSGIVAKEVVVGTLGTLYGAEGAGLTAVLQQQFTPLSGYAFLVMTLIYIPCIAAIAVIRQETNWRWAGVAVGYTLALGWMVSVGVYQIGSALGFGP